MRDVISGCACFVRVLLRFDKKLFYRLRFKNLFLRLPLCLVLLCDRLSTINSSIRLFGCVFLVWRHHLRKVNKSSVRTFRPFFLQFSYFLMFINIQIDLIILKTYDQQFSLTTKKSLHITFKANVSDVAIFCPVSVSMSVMFIVWYVLKSRVICLHWLWPPYVIGQSIISLPCGFFYLSIFLSPNLSGRRVDVYHTSTYGVALVQI